MLFGLRKAMKPSESVSGQRYATSSHPVKPPVQVGRAMPNWTLLDKRKTQVPLYLELPKNKPTVIVMNPIPLSASELASSQQRFNCGKRLKSYHDAMIAFQEAGVSVLFVCPQTALYNIPLLLSERLNLSFASYMLSKATLDELKNKGCPFEENQGILLGKPGTIIVGSDREVIGYSDNQGVDPESEALCTLEYMFKTKLAINERVMEKKFGM